MRKIWLVGALTALALAACGRTDVVDDSERCLTAQEAEAKIEACTAAAQNESLTPEQRSVAYSTRGDAQGEAGDVTAALRDYGSALELDEENLAALLGRGRILVASGQLDAAEPVLRRAIELHQSGEANDLVGQIMVRQGEFVEAITFFNAALNHDPRSATALAGRARAKQRLGDLDGAANDYDQAIRADGNLAVARAGRCWLDLNENRELERARQDADAAVTADARNIDGQLCRGVLQLRDGQWADAKTSFEAALAVESGNPIALFGRGVARRRSGDRAGAEDMNQARDFDGHIGEQFDHLGVQTY
ncbi:MAG: tetratricopeptide repeat protein [Hyphomonadaceae bacterium]|jgi:tetratricopeptide (TPR) repeat protein|nr:tetratricopeptide repeat protein [Hyphomonadaceae bacterium]